MGVNQLFMLNPELGLNLVQNPQSEINAISNFETPADEIQLKLTDINKSVEDGINKTEIKNEVSKIDIPHQDTNDSNENKSAQNVEAENNVIKMVSQSFSSDKKQTKIKKQKESDPKLKKTIDYNSNTSKNNFISDQLYQNSSKYNSK